MTAPATAAPSAAFFDLDRTLIAGASTFVFGWVAFRRGLIPTRELLDDARQAMVFRATGGSDDQSDSVRDRILEAVAGKAQADAVALNDEILPRLLESVRPETRKAVEKHREAGRDTWIVSASPIEIVQPLAEALGMTGAIATESEVEDGLYTGRLAKAFVYGDGKVQRIDELAEERGYDLQLCWAYSDSRSDLPMLRMVGHPVAVNPDKELRRTARRENWPIVHFSQRTKRGVTIGTSIVGGIALAIATYFLGRKHGMQHRPGA